MSFHFSPHRCPATCIVNVERFVSKTTDIERTYEPHVFVQSAWIENWFQAQILPSHITDFGLGARHFKTGVARENTVSAVPDAVLPKLVAIFEAKLRRKKVALIPLVPHEPLVEVTGAASVSGLKEPLAPVLHSSQSQPSSSRPGTPTSQRSRQTDSATAEKAL